MRSQSAGSGQYQTPAIRPGLQFPSWLILQRFRQMDCRDIFRARQIGNRPRQLQDSMVGPGREPQLLEGVSHQVEGFLIEGAELADLMGDHVPICGSR